MKEFHSDCVTTSLVSPGVLMIEMHDRVNKNMFSDEIIVGLIKAFRSISPRDDLKVVILTGYDNYFATGATPNGLSQILEKKAKFTDINIYSLALDCPIPVISAMQGHALGGGFVMGLYSDIVVLGRENIYSANFMSFGFTPGMGATYILPLKLGMALGHEMLLNGGNYRGADLQERGVPFQVVNKSLVLEHCLDLAADLAKKPRLSLLTLKQHLVRCTRQELDVYVQEEVHMHELTFDQKEVRDSIATLQGH